MSKRKKRKKRLRLSKAQGRNGKQKRKELIALAGSICAVAECMWTNPCALEFHHIGKKRFTLDAATLGRIQDERLIMDEFEKCILLCSNHHKLVHAGQIVLPPQDVE